MVIDNIILFISIVSFLLTIFVFFNVKKKRQHASFLVFSLISTFWLFINFLLRIYPSGLIGPLSYGLGILLGTAGLVWIYDLVEEKRSFLLLYCIMPLSVVWFFITSFTEYVVSFYFVLESIGYKLEQGPLFLEYTLCVGIVLLLFLYKLGRALIKENDALKKRNLSMIFFGSIIFGLFSYSFSFLMPIFFNIAQYSHLTNIAYFLFLTFITYSIVRHGLFEIKIIITQFLVIIFLSLLLLNFLFSKSANEYIWSGILLLASTFISYLIIKSIFQERESDKKLIIETQKSLELERVIRQEFLNESNEVIRKMEKIIGKK